MWRSGEASKNKIMNKKITLSYPILVHSHLRWDWVWQRPQQFLSRFSVHHPILFVEEPSALEGIPEPRAQLREVPDLPNLLVLSTYFPPEMMSNRALLDARQKRLVQGVIARQLPPIFERPVQWFYDPMAAKEFAGQMGEQAIVYDCMDQLSQFRGAPPELVRREAELLAKADVVFAGGPKIHQAKRVFNANCHSYGCGVDVEHFGRARAEETVLPRELAELSGPILGFFGVVDERMDYDLLSFLAAQRPDWNLVILGPTAKVDPHTLPQHPNLHWLGARDYKQLPAYVKGFDICMMPFAINEATEFINPTKALEYMATGRPIISTPVEDVVLQFSEIVHVASSHEEFLAACQRNLSDPDHVRIKLGLSTAADNTWEAIVAEMEEHIDTCLAERESSLKKAA
jgi:glycosyltransferase involved in cell wall biosynthesis